MRNRLLLVLCALVFLGQATQSRADEGMWIPLLLGEQKIAEMQAKGFKLSAEDVYSINKTSMKDGIVLFGGGCTGSVISDQGMLLTNHHCGYSAIQAHSTVDEDYLTDGFWAADKSKELPCKGLKVTFLIRMEEVTDLVLESLDPEATESERNIQVTKALRAIERKAEKGSDYRATVKPFFEGNQFFLFITQEYTDIRLVGAPPSAIGKFGGDTDNWMWPRHSGDFSLFRIYANKNNQPAEYAKDNVPYVPKKHFAISMGGVQPGDFTMVFGFPGHTQEYLCSAAVEMIRDQINPIRIQLRASRLHVMNKYMEQDKEVRLKYASKQASASNAWKKWTGENRGLKRLKVVENKQVFEQQFEQWANSSQQTKQYAGLIVELTQAYTGFQPYEMAEMLFFEAPWSIELVRFAANLRDFYRINLKDDSAFDELVNNLRERGKGFFKNYDQRIDREIFAAVMKVHYEKLPFGTRSDFFELVDTQFKGDFDAYTNFIFEESFCSSQEHFNRFLDKLKPRTVKRIEKDPAYRLYVDMVMQYIENIENKDYYTARIDSLNRQFMRALQFMDTSKVLYPDANSTMRIAFGQVDDFYPRDGVKYTYCTTLAGVMEKEDSTIYDFQIPQRLKELYQAKDYGDYGVNGTMPVCFIASNHTTGGNSGSPVFNANGQVIGLNFDRNWEGTMSDLEYSPALCRNISVDMRYMLFIIDKFAGAKNIINELTLVNRLLTPK